MLAGRNRGLGRFRDSRSERGMRAPAVEMGHEFIEGRFQMPIAKREEVIQTVAAKGTDCPLGIGIRGRGPDRSFQSAHAKRLQRAIKVGREFVVAIMVQEARGVVEGQKLAELLNRPLGVRMFGHVDVDDPARTNFHRQEDIRQSDAGGDRNKEIASNDCFGAVANEGRPAPVCGFPATRTGVQILAHRTRRDQDAEFETEFVRDALLAPGRVVPVHFLDEAPDVFPQSWTSALARLPAPEHPERHLVPFDEGVGLDDPQCLAPVNKPREGEECQAQHHCGALRLHLALPEQGKLFAQKEILGDQCCAGRKEKMDESEQSSFSQHCRRGQWS